VARIVINVVVVVVGREAKLRGLVSCVPCGEVPAAWAVVVC
jgi:hypothetical protein